MIFALLAAALTPSPLIVVSSEAVPTACPVVETASEKIAAAACGDAPRLHVVVIEGDAIQRGPVVAPPPVAPGRSPMRLETVVSYTLDSGRPVALSVETSPEHIARDLITLRSAAATLQGPGTSWQAREY